MQHVAYTGLLAPRGYFQPDLPSTSTLRPPSHHASTPPRVLGSQSRTRTARQSTEITKSSPMPSATSTAQATSGKRRINPTRNPRSPTLFSPSAPHHQARCSKSKVIGSWSTSYRFNGWVGGGLIPFRPDQRSDISQSSSNEKPC
jgi:hypothetical protein